MSIAYYIQFYIHRPCLPPNNFDTNAANISADTDKGSVSVQPYWFDFNTHIQSKGSTQLKVRILGCNEVLGYRWTFMGFQDPSQFVALFQFTGGVASRSSSVLHRWRIRHRFFSRQLFVWQYPQVAIPT